MRYIDICTKEDYVNRMMELADTRVARVPVLYVDPRTEYWISENGNKVFVVHDICGRMFIDSIKIFTKKRSLNSNPYIRYRTNRNTQVSITVSRAVYGAFILKDSLPKQIPYHKDGDPLNCSLDNLESTELDGRLKINLQKFADVYLRHYKRLTDYCQVAFAKGTQDAEDIVSDSFIAACQRRTVIRNIMAVWMLSIQKRAIFREYMHNHRTLDFLEWSNHNNKIQWMSKR